jgi:prefoldin subunit 5
MSYCPDSSHEKFADIAALKQQNEALTRQNAALREALTWIWEQIDAIPKDQRLSMEDMLLIKVSAALEAK